MESENAEVESGMEVERQLFDVERETIQTVPLTVNNSNSMKVESGTKFFEATKLKGKSRDKVANVNSPYEAQGLVPDTQSESFLERSAKFYLNSRAMKFYQ